MKKTKIIFWIVTILFCGFMLSSAIPELIDNEESRAFMNQLGYPDYVNPFLGVLKLLGIAAILIPGYPIIKEWAYAGLFFDLLGATYSLIAKFGLSPGMSVMFLSIVFLFLSYFYYHRLLREKGSAEIKPAGA